MSDLHSIPPYHAPIAKIRGRAGSPSGSEPMRLPQAGAKGVRSGIPSQSGMNHLHVERIEQLPRDVGWLLFGVGFAGFVAPGVFGLPFMVAGGMILWPRTTSRLHGLLGKRSPQTTNAGIKQIWRFLDDLERRYPSTSRR